MLFLLLFPPCPPSGILEADADQWERACDTLLMCIVTVLNHGLRNGGGVGDILRKPSKDVSFGSTSGPSLPSPAADPTVELPFLPGNCGTASFFPYSRPSVLSSSLPHHTPVIAPHLAPSAYSHCSKARLEWLEERCVRCMFFFPNCPLQESLFPARVVYDLLFFFIVIIIVLNLIFGVIIDTFADLRSEKQKKEEILKTTCFICGECWDPGSACLQELPPCGSSLLRLTCGMREGKEFPLLWVFIWFTAKLKSLH